MALADEGVASSQSLAQRCRTLVDRLVDDIERTPDPARAFALAGWAATFLGDNFFGLYRLDALELALLSRFDRVSPPASATPRDGTLHVLTEPYPHGGHTRLLRLILQQSGPGDRVLLTRRKLDAAVADWLGIEPGRLHVPDAEGAAAVPQLAAAMASHRRVVLYIHPDDVIGAVAARLAKRWNTALRIGLFDHADHSFSAGLGASDSIFEIGSYGWQLRQPKGIAECASFVGIPIATTTPAQTQDAADAHGTYVLTAGAAYKYRPHDGASLPRALARLLREVPAVRLNLIGPDARDPWWRELDAVDPSRVRFLGTLPHAVYARWLQGAALFVDSHPKTGGTAFPEALIAGTPVIGLKGGTWGFSMADTLRADSEDDFVRIARRVLQRDPVELARQDQVRAACRAYHAPAAVLGRMQRALDGGERLEPPPEIAGLGMPPLLAEIEWARRGQVRVQLPARRGPHALFVHGRITAAHAAAFGWGDRGTWRLCLTWPARAFVRPRRKDSAR